MKSKKHTVGTHTLLSEKPKRPKSETIRNPQPQHRAPGGRGTRTVGPRCCCPPRRTCDKPTCWTASGRWGHPSAGSSSTPIKPIIILATLVLQPHPLLFLGLTPVLVALASALPLETVPPTIPEIPFAFPSAFSTPASPLAAICICLPAPYCFLSLGARNVPMDPPRGVRGCAHPDSCPGVWVASKPRPRNFQTSLCYRRRLIPWRPRTPRTFDPSTFQWARGTQRRGGGW